LNVASTDEKPVPTAQPAGQAASEKKLWQVGTLVYGVSGLVLLFTWLLWGDFALSMRERSVGPLIEKFLLVNGASNTLKQVLTAVLPTIIGLILGPIIAYRSDRFRSRWGRRIPFLIIPTPVAGLAMVGIAFSPQMGQWLYKAMGNAPAAGITLQAAASAYTLSIFTVLWTIFEVAVIVSGAVFGGLINDVVPRPVLGRFHGLFRSISLYDGILFNALLFKHAEQHFTLLFALVGVLFGGGFTLMCLKIREGQYPPPPPENEALHHPGAGAGVQFGDYIKRFWATVENYFRECYSQPYYLLCFAMFILGVLMARPINDFTIRYAAQLNVSDSDYGVMLAGSYLVSLIIAFPLGMIVDRIHPIRASLVALVLYAIVTAYGSFCIVNPTTFGIALVGHTIISGTYFTCAASLQQQLLPRSKFSQYGSASGILSALTSLVYAPTIGLIMDLTNNNYRLTFRGSFILTLIGIVVMLLVYRRFMAYGGPKAYHAPGDEGEPRMPHEPPAHLWKIIFFYMVGAGTGAVIGFIASYLLKSGTVAFADYPTLLINNKEAREMAVFITATGVLPGAAMGGLMSNWWVKRLKRASV
jgi:MFS family permease